MLTRADSFKRTSQHPIVANAEQMLIVASLRLPGVKWGLVDRMIVAARVGGLRPIICLNKMDLAASPLPMPSNAEPQPPGWQTTPAEAREVLRLLRVARTS